MSVVPIILFARWETIRRELRGLFAAQTIIMRELAMSNQEHIDAVADQVRKGTDEVLAEIQALKDAQAAGETLDFSGLDAAAATLDDIVPDVPPDEQPPEGG